MGKSTKEKFGIGGIVFGAIAGAICLGFLLGGLAYVVYAVNKTDKNTSDSEKCCNQIKPYIIPTDSDTCDDGNDCTANWLVGGTCQNPNVPNDSACTSACFNNSAGTCFAGTCEGTCAGECVTNATCPDLGSFYAAVGCNYGSCVYNSIVQPLPEGFGGACEGASTILRDICLSGADTTYTDCLRADVSCANTTAFTCLVEFGCSPYGLFV